MQCAYSKNFPMCNACVLKIPRELVQRKRSLLKIFYIQNVPLENSNAYFTFSRSLQSNVCIQKFINMHMHSQKKISMQCRYSKKILNITHTHTKNSMCTMRALQSFIRAMHTLKNSQHMARILKILWVKLALRNSQRAMQNLKNFQHAMQCMCSKKIS